MVPKKRVWPRGGEAGLSFREQQPPQGWQGQGGKGKGKGGKGKGGKGDNRRTDSNRQTMRQGKWNNDRQQRLCNIQDCDNQPHPINECPTRAENQLNKDNKNNKDN